MVFASSVRRGADVIFSLSWPELKDKLLCLRAEKAMRTANILLAPRFGGDKAMAGGTDTFDSLCLARDTFGTNFRYVNVHELMDYLSPLPEEGNHTTPWPQDHEYHIGGNRLVRRVRRQSYGRCIRVPNCEEIPCQQPESLQGRR